MKYLFYILVLASLVACRPEEKVIPVKKTEPKWVLNSRISEDGAVWVAVAYSVPPDEVPATVGSREWMEALMIDSLKVEIEYAGVRQQLERQARGIYVLPSANIPLYATADIWVYDRSGKVKLSAQSVAQPKPEIRNMDAMARVRPHDTLCEIELTVTKPAEEAWYLVSFSKTSELGRLQQRGRLSLGQVMSDRNFLQERAVLLNSTQFTADSFRLRRELKWLNPSDTLVVSVAKLERPYHRFVEVVLRSSGWLNQLLGDAVNYPGNVQGGLGYFTLHRSEVRIFVMSNRVR